MTLRSQKKKEKTWADVLPAVQSELYSTTRRFKIGLLGIFPVVRSFHQYRCMRGWDEARCDPFCRSVRRCNAINNPYFPCFCGRHIFGGFSRPNFSILPACASTYRSVLFPPPSGFSCFRFSCLHCPGFCLFLSFHLPYFCMPLSFFGLRSAPLYEAVAYA